MNINSQEYWERRFATGDWERRGGRRQTANYAAAQIGYLRIDSSFSGTLIDFGCGLGDAMPIYRSYFPFAKLIGVDVSAAAIDQCRSKYGDIASFHVGNHQAVPQGDVIVASHVLEHLESDESIAAELLARCRELYVVVPYRERLAPGGEHVNTYSRRSFKSLGPAESHVFLCRGWTEFGFRLWREVYAKNLLRPFFGKTVRRRGRLIIFRFVRSVSGDPGALGPALPGA